MPRQLTHVVQMRVPKRRYAGARFDKVYGDSYGQLACYLRDKYGIDKPDAHRIIHDVFRFIEMAVLAGETGGFTVPRFGRFERREVRHSGGPDGSVESSVVLRFTRAHVKQTYIDFDDPEWVDPEDG